MEYVNQTLHQQISQTVQHVEEHELSTTTFTCEICIEPVTLPNDKFKNSNKCVHPFCTDCINKYIQAKLDDNISDIKCPAPSCDHLLEPLSCRPKITNQLFNNWCDVLCKSTVQGFDGVYCPNIRCSSLVINECGGGDDLKKCICPSCKKPFCFQCKVSWHAGYMCDESGGTRDANDIAFGLLSERKKWMRCPECRHCVELVAGCIIVRCRCRIEFCYRCGRKVYNHRCRYCARIVTNFSAACFIISFLAVVGIMLWVVYFNT